MAINLTVNGTVYQFPQTGDEQWGDIVTNWATAVTNGMLQKSGGLFTLTAEVDFGANQGLKSVYFKSRSANVASAGQIRLANADVISFRNSVNSANLDFRPGSSDAVPQYNSIDLVNLSTAQTLLNKIQGSNLLPSAHNTLDIGSNAVRWKDGYFQGNVAIAGSLTAGSVTFTNITTTDLTAIGNTIIGDANTDTLSIVADLVSSIRPDATNTYDLGSSSNRWRDIFVSRDGYINRVLLGNGSVGSPALSFESDTPLGIYRDSGSSMQLVAGGAVKLQVTLTQLTAYVPLKATAGSAADPTYSFSGDPDTGFYSSGVNEIGVATGGNVRVRFRDDGLRIDTRIIGADGTGAVPMYSFLNDDNTGIFRVASDNLGFATGGNQAGNVDSTRKWTFGQVGDSVIHRINGSLEYASSASLGMTQDPLKQTTLTDNTTGNVFLLNAAQNTNVVVEYSIRRGTSRETGLLLIVHDGTTAQVSASGSILGTTGVSFTADINSGNLRLRYTTTSTGTSATMRYGIRRWLDS